MPTPPRPVLVAGLDVGGSAVKAWAARTVDGVTVVTASRALATRRPARFLAEFDPAQWWSAARGALTDVAQQARAVSGAVDWAGITVASLRQGFVLLDASGQELGNGVLNSDRRGAAHQEVLAGHYALLGHWPAPELTLPKLLHIARNDPDRWAATRRIAFVHDWLLWRLCGAVVTGVDYACAGAMAAVAARDWATEFLGDVGIKAALLAPVVEAGTVVGALGGGWPLPSGTPVVSGAGDTQLAAMGAGGLADGVITVVAGSSTPVQAATAAPVVDAQQHPWVSTHARADLWAAETNCGYPGTMAGWLAGITNGAAPSGQPGAAGVTAVVGAPLWTQQGWATKAPMTVLGLRPDTSAADLAQAFAEAHAFTAASNIADLERALGRTATDVVLTGGAGVVGLAPLLAAVAGRPVVVAAGSAAAAGVALVTGESVAVAGTANVPAGDPAPYRIAYQRYLDAHATLRTHLPEADQ